MLHGRIHASLAATSGIHSGGDVLKMLMAGAAVTMLCSVLLRRDFYPAATGRRKAVGARSALRRPKKATPGCGGLWTIAICALAVYALRRTPAPTNHPHR